MKTYDLEIVVEHRYKLTMQGEDRVDAVNKALVYAVENEKELTLIDADFGVESIVEHKDV